MNAPIVLALFGGICLASFSRPADGTPDVPDVPDVPINLKREIQKLATHFNVYKDKTLFGNPIFLQNIYGHEKFEENEQRLLLHESLNVYSRILSDMLNQTQDMEIRMSIIQIKERVGSLRENNFDSKEQDLLRQLQNLWALKTNDRMVQRKAVRELLTVLQCISDLHNRTQLA